MRRFALGVVVGALIAGITSAIALEVVGDGDGRLSGWTVAGDGGNAICYSPYVFLSQKQIRCE